MGSLRTQALFDTIRNESPFLRAVAAKVLSVLFEQMRDRKVGDGGCQHQGVELGNVQQIVEQLVHGGNRRVDLLEDSAPFGGRHGPVQSADEQTQGM